MRKIVLRESSEESFSSLILDNYDIVWHKSKWEDSARKIVLQQIGKDSFQRKSAFIQDFGFFDKRTHPTLC